MYTFISEGAFHLPRDHVYARNCCPVSIVMLFAVVFVSRRTSLVTGTNSVISSKKEISNFLLLFITGFCFDSLHPNSVHQEHVLRLTRIL
jgi:hypothetical protein